jgi:long-chain acyl-CoA synthetase
MDSILAWEEKRVGNVVLKLYNSRPMSVWQLFSETVSRFPDRDAVKFNGITTTYKALHDRASGLGEALKAQWGVRAGDRIAMFLKNDDAFPLAFLSISKVGAVSVVLNINLKRPVLEEQLKITGATGAVVDEEIWDQGLDACLRWKLGKADLIKMSASGPAGDLEPADEEDLHTILFTSGTTGKPKGAAILHRNLIHSALRMEQYMGEMGTFVAEGAKTIVAAPLFHVMALQEQWLPGIRMGSTAILMEKLSVLPFVELLLRERAEYLVAPPAVYRILLSREEFRRLDVSCVRLIGFGGAPMPPDLINEMRQVFVNAKLINGFGLTEASVSAVGFDRDCLERPTSIGRPSIGCEVRIVDLHMGDVPRGEIGEIAVQGPNVAAGYYNDPKETEAKFRDGWFLTGDLGRMDREGFVYVSGRMKDIIIRGGENIYPVEVENVLCLHPHVLEAAVFGVPDPFLGERVAATIVPLPGGSITEAALKDFCKDILAAYQIPEFIRFTSAIPKNPAGKVIKKRLQEEFTKDASGGI